MRHQRGFTLIEILVSVAIVGIIAALAYPPSPVLVSVKIDGKTYQAAISGAQALVAPAVTVNSRKRTYWYKVFD